MFRSLLRAIFPSAFVKKTTPNYEYFHLLRSEEESNNTANISVSQEPLFSQIDNLAGQIKDHQEIDYDKLFFDLLFGDDDTQYINKIDPLSDYVADQINDLLLRPQNLISELPVMPASVDAVLTAINNKNFNVNEILNIIAKEPSMAASMIKLANTAKYRRSDVPIVSLKSAFMVMGSQGLLEGVVYVFINNFSPKNTPYFKYFGTKIWQHALQTALISKDLADKSSNIDNASAAYLIGLLRNLGEMIIFDLMVEAFHHVDPSATPSSQTFKALISYHSISLTAAIVSKWNLPPMIIETIKQQENKQLIKSPLATLIEEASFISKLQSLYSYKKVNQEQYELACQQLKNEQVKAYALNVLPVTTE
ncbi:HDOD domain-containing protein [Colwellia sp. BRX8-7]|jgi:HD-like signal output (HDOD) protein|uniref:HDOD domain-containing protein n=1 Tax=Colwellia sp. BRX8-7 TaxID=2759833 RepID=UPI0015F49D35|nr:HDOD domain-containing protein [Colwellia sp. BRX8-7]MBA6337743.1 HDOD domain-containing protein [Colwellia sp. BRX8-7]